MQVTKKTHCILCNSNKLKRLARIDEYVCVRCEKCNLIFFNPLPVKTTGELNDFYEKLYYPTCKYMDSFDKQNFKRYYPSYEKQFKAFYKYLSKGRILEIGCGVGYFLLSAKRKGFKCFGVEISKEAAKYTQEQLGIDAFAGTLENAKLPSNYFDGARLSHVLEHCEDPVMTINEVNRVLKPNGILEVGVPNPDCFLNRVVNIYYWFVGKYKKGKYFCSLGGPGHLYAFKYKTIIFLLRKAGFKILKISCIGRGNRTYLPFLIGGNLGKSPKGIFLAVVDLMGNILENGSNFCIFVQKVN
jgi:SAM-dependent methyltransferase